MSLYIQPNWPAPSSIKAYTTLKEMAVSKDKMDRHLLKEKLNLPSEPIWIEQKHTNIPLKATFSHRDNIADATFTDQPNCICLVFTADCLPLLVCHQAGTKVAAIHAGWRGLAAGIITNTLKALQALPSELLVWLGPAISQSHFEVGPEVRHLFLTKNPKTSCAFIPSKRNRWLADLYQLAKIELNDYGIQQIYGGEYCTYTESDKFYSYRRDQGHYGRMASLIWINDSCSSK